MLQSVPQQNKWLIFNIFMQQTNPRVLKERSEKYEKLIRMIKGFQRTHEQMKMLDKIKSDTVFEISLRFRRCEANKTYKFPKTAEANESDSQDEANNDLISNKELIYNLHTQNKLRIDPSREKHRIKLLQLQDTSPKRQRTEATSIQTTRVLSLNHDRSRNSRQRIDRIQKLHHWAAERDRQKTERVNQRKIDRSAVRIPTVMQRFAQNSKGAVKSEMMSKNSSSQFSQIKALAIASRRQVCKTEASSTKIDRIDRSKPKIKLVTESAESPPRQKISQKKLYTQESGMETVKKGRIHNFLSNQVKKVEKTLMLVNMTDTHRTKPKNLFYKPVY